MSAVVDTQPESSIPIPEFVTNPTVSAPKPKEKQKEKSPSPEPSKKKKDVDITKIRENYQREKLGVAYVFSHPLINHPSDIPS